VKLISLLAKGFFSYPFIIVMLFILGAAAGVATFVESTYDVQTARVLIYDAFWYEVVMVALTLSMIGVMYKSKMWYKKGAFIVHLAFVVILIGAGMTRYFGYEGVIHIREGMSENEMIGVKPYFQIKTDSQVFEYPLSLGQIGNNHFKYRETLKGKSLVVEYQGYRASPKGNASTVYANVTYDNITKRVMIEGGSGWINAPTEVQFDNLMVALSWGSKVIELPFSLKLIDFQLERYAGSMSPSSYASDIEVLDNTAATKLPYRIFMNHPLNYKGYKFFQSSYDTDEKGTILEVNKDPGKWPTYLGYFLLCVGFLLNFFTKGSRFLRLKSFLQKNSMMLLLPVLFLSTSSLLKADNKSYLETFKLNSSEHANHAFSALLVQDYMGRVKPISTEAIDIVNKLSGKSSLYGLTPEQIILGMVTNPSLWEQMKIIKLGNAEIKKVLHVNAQTEYVSFAEIFDEAGYYKLAKQVNAANQKAQSKRDTFDNDIIKFDEKLNIAYLTFKGVFFKFIPIPEDPDKKWVDPNEAFNNPFVANETKRLVNQYLVGLQEGIANNQWSSATTALEQLKENQRRYSKEILPSEARIKAEVLYNHLGVFQKLISGYLILGLIALCVAMLFIFLNQNNPLVQRIIFYAFVVCFSAHTFGLALRWFISGHAPWSDSYESLIYIGWSAGLAGIVVFRKSTLALSAASILAGIVMLVAHLSFINPQITNLVPVLKSYWLTIHVSVITASYGFLGLGALLGFITLSLMLVKNRSNRERINVQIRQLTAINEMSLIIGLAMLTVGNFFGGIWANESWGRYWGWDPKETWSFVSIIVYALVLHVRFIPKLNTIYAFSVASLIGFSSILMTYFGVNFYLTGMHSYAASGEHPSLPVFVYYAVAFIVALCAFAYRGRDVKPI